MPPRSINFGAPYPTPRSTDFGTWFSLLIALLFICAPCRGVLVDDEAPVKAVLATHGFTDYSIQDRSWFVVGLRGCQADEAAQFNVTANNPVGTRVSFLVCTGWPFKGGSIRTEW